MSGTPIPFEAIALASVLLSIGCLVMAGIHALRIERHHQKGDRQ